MPREQTYIMIKPDGVQRALIGNIIGRFEAKGFKLVALKMETPSKEHLEAHYADLKSKKFFPSLIAYMQMGPVVCMVWEGDNAVKTGRVMLGATNPAESLPGTIRGDLCIDVGRNICHGSDSVASAQHEINLWFPEGVNSYRHHSEVFVYEKVEEDTEAAPPAPVAEDGFVPYEGEYSENVTYSDDAALGKPLPDFSSLKMVQYKDEGCMRPIVIGEGEPCLVVLFAKYLKYECWPAINKVNALAKEFGVQCAGLCLDRAEKDVLRFCEKKQANFDAITIHFDNGWKVKNLFQDLMKGQTITLPSLFIVDKDGIIVWRQQLTGMSGTMVIDNCQFEYQFRQFMAGKSLGSHGPSGIVEEEDDEDLEEAEDVFASQTVEDAKW
jgi:nucleoside-diphosphate kinase